MATLLYPSLYFSPVIFMLYEENAASVLDQRWEVGVEGSAHG